MGRAGRVRVLETFSWRAVAKATAAAYEEVIAAHAANEVPPRQGENDHADR
jgi:hypothetical protein